MANIYVMNVAKNTAVISECFTFDLKSTDPEKFDHRTQSPSEFTLCEINLIHKQKIPFQFFTQGF